jgi:hypothetical protein
VKPEVEPIASDPAGLDKLLLAAGKGVARFLESLTLQKTGYTVELWDGADGLGAVLEEHLKAAGVPNKRLPEIVTPRAVIGAFTETCNRKRPTARRLKR